MASDYTGSVATRAQTSGRERRFFRFTLAGSLVPPLIGVYLLVASGGDFWPHVNVLTWYAILVCGLLELALRGWRGVPREIFLLLAALHLFFLTPEIYLRLAGFRHTPGIAHGGGHHPSRFVDLVEDEGLFWTLPPGAPGINSQGFRTRPLPRRRQPDLSRVVVLGDSLAYQGYPEMVETLLNSRPGEGRYEVLNMSLAGYSSYQGRRIVEKYGEAMAPDLAIIGYGWNDHWLAWGVPDEETVVRVANSPAYRLALDLYRRSRVAQAARYLVGGRQAGDGAGPGLRVPPASFRDNLVFLGEYLAARDAAPLFLTLPTAHHRLGVPEHLIEQGLARDRASVPELHAAYNRIIREVAGEHGWPMLDLDSELAPLTSDELSQIFISDGIHLTPAGLALFAQRVAAAISELVSERTDSGEQEPR